MALFRKKEEQNIEEKEPKGKAAKMSKTSKANKPEYLDRHAERKENGRINARIIDASSGLLVLTGVYAVRVLDKGVRRLFMNDYRPIIGAIKGDIIFLNKDGEHAYRNIRGFYKLQHNEFTLLIEGELGSAKEALK